MRLWIVMCLLKRLPVNTAVRLLLWVGEHRRYFVRGALSDAQIAQITPHLTAAFAKYGVTYPPIPKGGCPAADAPVKLRVAGARPLPDRRA